MPWNGLSLPVKYFTDRSKAVLLFWIFYFFLYCVCYAFVSVCLYASCGQLLGKGWPLGCRLWCPTEFVTFPLVSWVRCGTWLYRFLIFARLLIFYKKFENFYTCVKRLVHTTVFPGLEWPVFIANYSLMVILMEILIREMNLDKYRVIEFIFSTYIWVFV